MQNDLGCLSITLILNNLTFLAFVMITHYGGKCLLVNKPLQAMKAVHPLNENRRTEKRPEMMEMFTKYINLDVRNQGNQ
jgi:hypothetical protein